MHLLAQCLYVLTDDNLPAIRDVKSDAAYLSCLLSLARPEGFSNGKQKEVDNKVVSLQVLAAGILRNVSPIPPPSVASTVDLDKDILLPLLQPVITSISLQEVSNNVQELLQRQAVEPPLEKLSIKGTPKSDHKSDIEVQLEALEARLRTVQLSLEILTGVSATLPDPENDASAEEEDDDEDIAEDGTPSHSW